MDPNAALWAHCLRHAARTDVGLRRANNQDSLNVAMAISQQAWEQRGHLFVVADGMGAHAAGELASKIATDVVPLSYHKLVNLSPPEALVNAIWDANKQIHTRGQASSDFKGMGTTCSMLTILPMGALVAHVGDSRVYRVRGTRIDQLTFDHSLVWEMRHSGQVADEIVTNLVSKNIITRSLGPNAVVRPDLEGPFPVELGDTFVLCSDGLSNQVKDEEIGLIVATLPPDEAADTLIHLANLRGGPDNITVIVAQVTGPQVCQNGPAASAPPPAASHSSPVHPAVWIWMGVSLLAALVFLAISQFIAAMAAFASTGLAAIVTLIQHFSRAEGGVRFDGRPLGRGPHVSTDCAATPQLVGRFASVLDELHDAAGQEKWEIDLARIQGHIDRATAATNDGNHAQAAREYLLAIRFMMDQLKHQRHSSGDSSIFG
jgi:protein phosphatase